MVESLQVSAQLTTVVEVDVSKVARLRDSAKADSSSARAKAVLPAVLRAGRDQALKAHPTVNASVNGTEVTYHGAEHLGVAVDTERGLLVPVIKDAGDLNIAGIARKIADLAERTRDSKITPDELSGGTFTITNTGSRGALFDTPIINQPNVAILGTGAVVKRPVVVEDGSGGSTIAIRPMVYIALSYDHRIVDGADAARFLTTMSASRRASSSLTCVSPSPAPPDDPLSRSTCESGAMTTPVRRSPQAGLTALGPGEPEGRRRDPPTATGSSSTAPALASAAEHPLQAGARHLRTHGTAAIGYALRTLAEHGPIRWISGSASGLWDRGEPLPDQSRAAGSSAADLVGGRDPAGRAGRRASGLPGPGSSSVRRAVPSHRCCG